jgi:hypothetical protein
MEYPKRPLAETPDRTLRRPSPATRKTHEDECFLVRPVAGSTGYSIGLDVYLLLLNDSLPENIVYHFYFLP